MSTGVPHLQRLVAVFVLFLGQKLDEKGATSGGTNPHSGFRVQDDPVKHPTTSKGFRCDLSVVLGETGHCVGLPGSVVLRGN